MNATNLATLKLGPKLGDGGQGAVYELADDPARVFKRYHSPSGPGFSASTLDALIGMRGNLSNGGRPVDEWAAWPSSVVRDAQNVVGFLMPRVPTEFTFQAHGKRRFVRARCTAGQEVQSIVRRRHASHSGGANRDPSQPGEGGGCAARASDRHR